MPDVRSNACAATTRTWVAFDVHKDSLVAGILSAGGRQPEVVQLENSERALRRLLRRLGRVGELAACLRSRSLWLRSLPAAEQHGHRL